MIFIFGEDAGNIFICARVFIPSTQSTNEITVRVWCSLVSLKLAKLKTRVQIPAPAHFTTKGRKMWGCSNGEAVAEPDRTHAGRDGNILMFQDEAGTRILAWQQSP